MKHEHQAACVLFLLTLLSMFWVGANQVGADLAAHPVSGLLQGYTFALPFMAILLAHEFGHYFAARIHSVDASLPYFIPMPYGLLGTFGAVINMRGSIKLRDALFDIGAAGPLAGLCVALPVLIYGMATSPVAPIQPDLEYIVEGRSLLYLGLLYALKGPIPEGSDIMLTPTALAGWAGLLITMINLIPVGQLDGGHVAYALFGSKQDVYSRRIRGALLLIALVVGLAAGGHALMTGTEPELALLAAAGGLPWLFWWGVLTVLGRFTGDQHPATDPGPLSPRRRLLAWFTLALFVLLFMPIWMSRTFPIQAA
jgi:membrane-associated protease RseP (regulator of RpoE activity)